MWGGPEFLSLLRTTTIASGPSTPSDRPPLIRGRAPVELDISLALGVWVTATLEVEEPEEEAAATTLCSCFCKGSLEEVPEQEEDLAANPDSNLLSIFRLSARPLCCRCRGEE